MTQNSVKNHYKIPISRRLAHRALSFGSKVLSRNKLNILIYHQVVESFDPMRPTEPTRDDFYRQMLLIKQYYNPIALSDAVKLLAQSKLPANSICITFDDGYLNNFSIAAPILKELALPATIFVATKFSEGSNMWNDNLIDLISDPARIKFDLSLIDLGICEAHSLIQRRLLVDKVIKKVKYTPYQQRLQLVSQILLVNGKLSSSAKMMSPIQLKKLAQQGIEIAAHTHDHPILAVLEPAEQKAQITQSQQKLTEWLGVPIKGFAYPNGRWSTDYNSETIDALNQCEFDYAVSTDNGVSTPSTNPMQLNRFTPWNKDLLKFHLKLLINTVQ